MTAAESRYNGAKTQVAEIEVMLTYTTIKAPINGVVLSGQLEMVQLVKGQRVVRQMVKTGPSFGKKVEILSGLSQGDVVLVSPLKEDD